MEQIIYFLFWGALFYFMMRFCCGPGMMGHGKGHEHGGKTEMKGLGPFDPVCGMDVSDRTPLTTQFEGKTYYFCSTVCKNVFEKEPHKYVTGAGGKKEGTATCC
jgi:YHS domain-containing protein